MRFPQKSDVQTSYQPSNYVRANLCCENQISSGNLSHISVFDKRTLLFNGSGCLRILQTYRLFAGKIIQKCLKGKRNYFELVVGSSYRG